MTGQLIFTLKTCGGNPFGVIEFRKSWNNKYSPSLTLTTVDKIVMCKHKTEDNISNNEQKEIKGPRKQSIYLTTSEQ